MEQERLKMEEGGLDKAKSQRRAMETGLEQRGPAPRTGGSRSWRIFPHDGGEDG